MEDGYVRLWRKINDNPILARDNNMYIVFTKLLMFVDWRTGSMTSGRFMLAERMNMKPRTLYGVLKRLENAQMLNITSNNKFSVISICNWGTYQQERNSTDNNAATTTQQPRNTKQELIIKNKEVVTKVTMSTSQPTEKQLTYKSFFFELIKLLGFSDRTIPTKERMVKLKQRMTTYSPDQLRDAAKALAGDSRMQGDNEAGKRWGNIDYLLRNDTNVAKYLEQGESTAATNLNEVLDNVKW